MRGSEGLKASIVVTAMFLFLPSSVNACSCAGSPLFDLFERAEVAFVGTPVSRFDRNENAQIISSGDPIEYSFLVEMTWKGVESDTLLVLTPRGGSSCGYNFKIGERYLVLAVEKAGTPNTGLCSGNTPFSKATYAHYLFPKPTIISPGASWSAMTREDMLVVLQTGKTKKEFGVAALFAEEVLPKNLNNYFLTRLILAKPTKSVEILGSGWSAGRMINAFIEIGWDLFESGSTSERAVAVESLGILAQNESLDLVLQKGFSDPEEAVHAAARLVLFIRYWDLEISQANDHVSSFISTIEHAPQETRWVSIHHLGRFSYQRAQVFKFVEGFVDTATVDIEKETAFRVHKELGGDPGQIGQKSITGWK